MSIRFYVPRRTIRDYWIDFRVWWYFFRLTVWIWLARKWPSRFNPNGDMF